MHTHDASCGWVHREHPAWRGCCYSIDCTDEAVRVTLLGVHETGRRFRATVEVCEAHVPAMAEFAGAQVTSRE